MHGYVTSARTSRAARYRTTSTLSLCPVAAGSNRVDELVAGAGQDRSPSPLRPVSDLVSERRQQEQPRSLPRRPWIGGRGPQDHRGRGLRGAGARRPCRRTDPRIRDIHPPSIIHLSGSPEGRITPAMRYNTTARHRIATQPAGGVCLRSCGASSSPTACQRRSSLRAVRWVGRGSAPRHAQGTGSGRSKNPEPRAGRNVETGRLPIFRRLPDDRPGGSGRCSHRERSHRCQGHPPKVRGGIAAGRHRCALLPGCLQNRTAARRGNGENGEHERTPFRNSIFTHRPWLRPFIRWSR